MDRRLAEAPEGASLERFPSALAKISEREVWAKIRLRSAWSSTLIAGLELAKPGDVVLGQGKISKRSMSPRRDLTNACAVDHVRSACVCGRARSRRATSSNRAGQIQYVL
jgi:hypothetical protein